MTDKPEKRRLSALLDASVFEHLEQLRGSRSWPDWLKEIQSDFKKVNEERESLGHRLQAANKKLRELGSEQY